MSVYDPIRALRNGDLVVMIDATRGTGAELWLAAESAQPLEMARLVRYTSGFVSVAMTAARASALGLPPMVNTAARFDDVRPVPAVTCDAADGSTTGISARDRALTARLLACPTTRPDDLKRPGHVLPLRVRDRVTDPAAVASAALRLTAVAGLCAAMVRCELVHDTGELADATSGVEFARRFGLAVVDLQELSESSVARVA